LAKVMMMFFMTSPMENYLP